MIKSFLKGFGSVFNIMPPPVESARNKDVWTAIGSDFEAVGGYIQSAIEKFETDLPRHDPTGDY